jgi:hypothetical protein
MPSPASTLVPLLLAAGLIAGCRADSGRQAVADAESATPRATPDATPPAPPSPAATAASAPAGPATRGFAAPPPGAPLVYTCDDGKEVRVAYGADDATLTLPDGRTLRLPKAQSASKGGGEVYVGEAVSLMRDDVRLEVHQDEMPARTCHQHQT